MGAHLCTVNNVGVHSCRPLLGARASGYRSIRETFVDQHKWHAKRVAHDLDLGHAFAAPGQLPLSDVSVRRWVEAGNGLVHNWKPAAKWTDAAGGNPKINTHIDKAALKVKLLAPQKLHLVLHHEPENDVGSAGSKADYRAMWANVRERFDRLDVTNVIWGMAYMNYPKWTSSVPGLYPGDDLVDWVWFNAYGSKARPKLSANIAGFLDILDDHSIGVDKPRGIIEWSISQVSESMAVGYYEQAERLMASGVLDDVIRAWMVFDSPGTHNDGGLRLGYDDRGHPFPEKTRAYQKFARHFTCKDGLDDA